MASLMVHYLIHTWNMQSTIKRGLEMRLQYKVTYLFEKKPREYMVRATDGFEAEKNFLSWAKDLPKPVRVVRVERCTLSLK